MKKSPLEDPNLKKNIYQAPEGYFDDFTQQMMQRLPEKKEHPALQWATSPQARWLYRALPVAAIIIIVVALGVGYETTFEAEKQTQALMSTSPATEAMLEELSQEELALYLMEAEAVQPQEIVEATSEEIVPPSQQENASAVEQYLEYHLDLTEIESYL